MASWEFDIPSFLNRARTWKANGMFQGNQRLTNIDTPFLFGVCGALAFWFLLLLGSFAGFGVVRSEYEYKTLTMDVNHPIT